MQAYEYTEVTVVRKGHENWKVVFGAKEYDIDDRNKIMSLIGQKGWELVTSVEIIDVDRKTTLAPLTCSYVLFFKRPLAGS